MAEGNEKETAEVMISGESPDGFSLETPDGKVLASGQIKVITAILRKTGTLVMVYSDQETDTDRPSKEILDRLNYDTIAIYKLVRVIKAEDS